MGFQDHFSSVAGAYQAFRPRYPPEVFAWIAAAAPGRGRALDLGCGNGQASIGLAAHFEEVVGVDPSADQIARAEAHPRVRYAVAPAEATGLPPASVDAAVAAQAFHWFEPEGVARELARVARPGAIFAAMTYFLCTVDEAVDAAVLRLYRDVVGPWWPPERRHVESGYRTLPFPWPELETPRFEIRDEWPLDRFAGYLGTWSASSRHRQATGRDPVDEILPELRAAWGDPAAPRTVRWPVAVRAGRIG